MIFDPKDAPASWPALISAHLNRYPAMTVQDVYKLVYQGVMGPEHSIPSAEIFRQRLEAELAGLQPNPEEPLLEPIRPGGGLLRIHLRPWLALNRDLSDLIEVCLETARLVAGSLPDLERDWTAFIDDLIGGQFPQLSVSDGDGFSTFLVEHSFPPVHHSEGFTACYHPAYRLVAAVPVFSPNE